MNAKLLALPRGYLSEDWGLRHKIIDRRNGKVQRHESIIVILATLNSHTY